MPSTHQMGELAGTDSHAQGTSCGIELVRCGGRAQCGARVSKGFEHSAHRDENPSSVDLLADALESFGLERSNRKIGETRRIEEDLDSIPYVGLELNERIVLLGGRAHRERDTEETNGRGASEMSRHDDAPATTTTEFRSPYPSSGAIG